MSAPRAAAPAPASETDPSTLGAGAPGAEDEARVKRKKKKYSKGLLKIGQKAEISLSKGVHRLARAVEEGLGLWRERRDGSARKKRDGAVRDALKNYGKAATRFRKVAAKMPEEILKGFPKIRLFR
jgi:hypothetical protein